MAEKPNVFEVARDATAALEKLAPDEQRMALNFVAVALGLVDVATEARQDAEGDGRGSGSDLSDETATPSPAQFIQAKHPQSVLEEVACLAYYLARYKSSPRWKPADIDELNKDAGGNAFVRVSRDVSNAKTSGVVTPVGNGLWQLTRDGTKLVDALPDRERVKEALKARRSAKRAKRPAKKIANQ